MKMQKIEVTCDYCHKVIENYNGENDWEVITDMKIRRGTQVHGVYMGNHFCNEKCFSFRFREYFEL